MPPFFSLCLGGARAPNAPPGIAYDFSLVSYQSFPCVFALYHYHYRSASEFDICVLKDYLTFISHNYYGPSQRSYAKTHLARIDVQCI